MEIPLSCSCKCKKTCIADETNNPEQPDQNNQIRTTNQRRIPLSCSCKCKKTCIADETNNPEHPENYGIGPTDDRAPSPERCGAESVQPNPSPVRESCETPQNNRETIPECQEIYLKSTQPSGIDNELGLNKEQTVAISQRQQCSENSAILPFRHRFDEITSVAFEENELTDEENYGIGPTDNQAPSPEMCGAKFIQPNPSPIRESCETIPECQEIYLKTTQFSRIDNELGLNKEQTVASQRCWQNSAIIPFRHRFDELTSMAFEENELMDDDSKEEESIQESACNNFSEVLCPATGENAGEKPNQNDFFVFKHKIKNVWSKLKKIWTLRQSPKLKKYRPPTFKPTRQRTTQLWSETWGKKTALSLTPQELNRQESINEILQGEIHFIEDLLMIQTVYHQSLVHLGYISRSEANLIFGWIPTFISIHTEFRDRILKALGPNSCFTYFGTSVQEWIPNLKIYSSYCYQLIEVKKLLDEKKNSDPLFEDFLRRCLESSFSRRLDLWSYLDAPRSRLMKYPLLLTQTQKFGKNNHNEFKALEQALQMLRDVLDQVDRSTGLAICKQVIDKIDLPEEMTTVFEDANTVMCRGELETCQGIKLQCFLFNSGLVLTRADSRGRLNLYGNPFEAGHFKIVDLGSEVQQKTNRSKLQTRYLLRVDTPSESITLVTLDETNKKRWMTSLSTVVNGKV
ncbi:hypothetical protein OUZ56_004982 [Daphnia magna]|uniref:DH domain-containing protein n=1 Tax=Daphnia magna TaxID=35525 RepID=A0ABQ9YRF7_9CRUS|nr:hypothetical protein OUZ56_004982 [Daphnia magna]